MAEFEWCDALSTNVADVKAIIAIGPGHGFAVVKTLVGNEMWDADQEEFGGSPGDLFYEGATYPTEPGIYQFLGGTRTLGGGDWTHHGTFTLLSLQEAFNGNI